ncbi:MAG TPA: hypothetical protein VHA33_15420 [Candidatus Angelobacter sp.]|nr:hypothetical protein [Candidatus Angelobacter sp.]
MLKKTAFLLAFLIPCLVMAGTTGAILMGTGDVQVNGEQAAHSSTVFSGDRIQTAANGSALVKSPKGLVSIGADSLVKYQEDSVTLEHGVVALTVGKGIEAHLGNLVVSTDPEHNAKFQLLNANGVERIWAIEGSLNITDGVHMATLKAGEIITHMPSSSSLAADDDTVPGHKRAIPGWVKEVLIEGAIAGIVVGTLAATGQFDHHKPPVSPSHP